MASGCYPLTPRQLCTVTQLTEAFCLWLYLVRLEANAKLGEIIYLQLLLLLFSVFPERPYQTIHGTSLSIKGLNIHHNSLITEPLLIKSVQILQLCNSLRNTLMILTWTTSIDAVMKSKLSQTVAYCVMLSRYQSYSYQQSLFYPSQI